MLAAGAPSPRLQHGYLVSRRPIAHLEAEYLEADAAQECRQHEERQREPCEALEEPGEKAAAEWHIGEACEDYELREAVSEGVAEHTCALPGAVHPEFPRVRFVVSPDDDAS